MITLPKCIIHLSLLLILSLSRQLYFSMPYQTVRQQQSIQHLINVEINRYPYLIDITLLSQPDYIVSLQQASRNKDMVDRPDYRKNEENVFGIVELQGKQVLDERVQIKRRIAYNIYYYFRDYFPKLTWINLNNIQQIQSQDLTQTNSEGAFNFGPKHADSQILKDFKKYSKFMQKNIITFKGNKKNENGEIIFGEFPTKYILNESVCTTHLQFLSQDYWTMITKGLQLHQGNGRNIVKTDLYKQMVKVRLTISQRTIMIPSTSAQTLKRSIPQCTFASLPNSPDKNNYLSCSNLDHNDIQTLSFKFAIKQCQSPLSIPFRNIIITNTQTTYWFDIVVGEQDKYQMSQSILRDYMIGIDYKQGKLMYGLVVEQSWMTKELFIQIFVTGNLVIFLISLVIVLFQKKVKERMKIAIKEQFGLPDKDEPSKVNSYQLASASQEALGQ